jgi:hypothetical protein
LLLVRRWAKSFGGMTQMLLKEVRDLLSDLVDQLVGGIEYSEENLAEAIKKSLQETGIAKEVKIEELPQRLSTAASCASSLSG